MSLVAMENNAAASRSPDVKPATYRLPRDGRAAGEKPAESCAAEAEDLLARENAAWFCRLRWIVAGLLAAAAVAGYFPKAAAAAGLRLAPGWPLAVAAVLAACNLFYLALLSRPQRPAAAFNPRRNLQLQIGADLVILTAVVHFAGSVESYAPFAYLFHIIFACIFFSRLESLLVTLGAASLYLLCLVLEAGGLAPGTVLVHSGQLDRSALPWDFWFWRVSSALVVWLVIWHLASRLAGRLRERERELAAANARLLASNEERSRHMLQTTHQLKAPFAAVHANAQLLLGGHCGPLSEPARKIVERIAARCESLSRQIVGMLQLANLRSAAQARPEAVAVDLKPLVEGAVARLEPAAARRRIAIHARLEPAQIAIAEDHARMLVDNLLGNAVSYSYEGGSVEVRCGPGADGRAALIVRDEGIGIEPEKLPLVFQDYFRTAAAAAHNSGSTGLGLAIVRQVAQAWGIDVEVQSAVGKGTQFAIFFSGGETAASPSNS